MQEALANAIRNAGDSETVIKGYGSKYLASLAAVYKKGGHFDSEAFAQAAQNTPEFLMDCWRQAASFIFTWSCAQVLNTHNS